MRLGTSTFKPLLPVPHALSWDAKWPHTRTDVVTKRKFLPMLGTEPRSSSRSFHCAILTPVSINIQSIATRIMWTQTHMTYNENVYFFSLCASHLPAIPICLFKLGHCSLTVCSCGMNSGCTFLWMSKSIINRLFTLEETSLAFTVWRFSTGKDDALQQGRTYNPKLCLSW
jgi:hypothetical protein